MSSSGRSCVWIVGGPGSGKGTQCHKLAAVSGHVHLSTGDLLRSEVLAGTERWVRLFEVISSGQLAPDDEVVELVAGAMDKQPEAPGFLLDGFPANMTQAKLCKERMGEPVKVIVLEIPEPVMMARLKDGENFNDTEETIQKRIKTFNEETRPIIGENSKHVATVKADKAEAEVFAEVRSILGF